MTPERRAEIEAMLDHPSYRFTYGGRIGGLAGDAEHEEPANDIIRELLDEIDRLSEPPMTREAMGREG